MQDLVDRLDAVGVFVPVEQFGGVVSVNGVRSGHSKFQFALCVVFVDFYSLANSAGCKHIWVNDLRVW